MVHITVFEVPAEADEQFLGSWEPAAAQDVRLFRALRPDVDFRFASVATEAPLIDLPFEAHSGRYEIVHDDGSATGTEGVTLINPFEVPADADERFLAGWNQARELFAAQQGYLGTRLHRSLGPADFRFVNVVRWSSPLMFARALQRPELQRMTAAIPFASHPALYTSATRAGPRAR
jgi:heme oxygenase (mycobilin-producing)